MLAQDYTGCRSAFVQWNMKREVVIGVRNGTHDSKLCTPDEFVIADDKSRTETSLFMSLPGIKTDLDDIALFYHTSLPEGSPQSISEGSYLPLNPSKSAWIFLL